MPINVSKPIDVKRTEVDKRRDQIEELVNSPGVFLIVNGKIKKISKKSRYLIDMLTLEDS